MNVPVCPFSKLAGNRRPRPRATLYNIMYAEFPHYDSTEEYNIWIILIITIRVDKIILYYSVGDGNGLGRIKCRALDAGCGVQICARALGGRTPPADEREKPFQPIRVSVNYNLNDIYNYYIL